MKKLDLENWDRKEVFDFFSTLSDPYYTVSYRQDITKLYEYTKKHGLSFYYSMIYLVTQAFNSVEEFRLTIRGNDVFLLDSRMPSFTDMHKGSEVFHIVSLPLEGDMAEFCKAASEKSASQSFFLDYENETDELIYISCTPWIDLTGLTNEHDRLSPTFKDESIPYITWGKYVEENGRKVLGMSLEVNHRLIDGIHIGKFSEKLTQLIEAL